jgi:hypothetical protein
MNDGEQGTALRKYSSSSAPDLKKPGKPPKIPNRLPRIQSNTSSDFHVGTSTTGKKETAMQMVDRLLMKAKSMKAEMADQRHAVAEMRSDIQQEYRLAGVPDPAGAQEPDAQGGAHLRIEASFSPIINVPVVPTQTAGKNAELQSQVEYYTHEL